MKTGMTAENWADVATLGLLTMMWAVMLYYELRRTWKWDALGRALTVLTFCLLVSYGFGTVSAATTWNVWIPEVRWITRIALVASGVVTIAVLALDRSPSSATWNPEKPERRWGPPDRRGYEPE